MVAALFNNMKHTAILLAAAIVAATAALPSCGDKAAQPVAEATATEASTGETDSLALAAGYTMGASIGHSIEHYEHDSGEPFDKEAFLQGVKMVIDCDTTNEAFLVGLETGLQTIRQLNIADLDEMGLGFNRQMFYDQFAAAFKANPDEISEQEIMEKVATLQALKAKIDDAIAKHRMDQMVIENERRVRQDEANKQVGEE